MMERGQSLFEVVVALAISGLIIISLVSLVSNSIRNSTFSKNKAVAASYAQQATEWLRGQRDIDTASFETNVLIPKWCLKDLAWTQSGPCGTIDQIVNTPFTREVSFIFDTVNGKSLVQADVAVFWEDTQGVHQVTSSTNFSDWRQR